VLTGADDDMVDVDTGYTGTIQYVIAVQKASANPDSMIELDSANPLEGQQPRTHLKLANFTFVHRLSSGNSTAMLLRGGADATLVNGVVVADHVPAPRRHQHADGRTRPSVRPVRRCSRRSSCSVVPRRSPAAGVTAQQTTDVFAAG
jgi:hypothetical protein